MSNPIGVIFTGCFMSMLDIVGQQITNLTPYNEYISDVIVATIVYLSAFSLLIKMLLTGRRKKKLAEAAGEAQPTLTQAAPPPGETVTPPDSGTAVKGGDEA